ncbi:MAG: caspase family protein, partial [Leptospiraceae bacterium]|nr:caspase family protein [Leptospiraceae bacterium]
RFGDTPLTFLKDFSSNKNDKNLINKEKSWLDKLFSFFSFSKDTKTIDSLKNENKRLKKEIEDNIKNQEKTTQKIEELEQKLIAEEDYKQKLETLLKVEKNYIPENTEKLALVIGGKDYLKLKKLNTSINDADEMSRTLKKLGFQITKILDPDKKSFHIALNEFESKIQENKNNNKPIIALFYFSGHGLQYNGNNYLVPIDANIRNEIDISTSSIDLKEIVLRIKELDNFLDIFIIDACRNNPFSNLMLNSTAIFNKFNLNNNNLKNTIISFSTSPGESAIEYSIAKNSVFTQELISNMRIPNLDFEEILKITKENVVSKTNQIQNSDTGAVETQIPYYTSSFFGKFILNDTNSKEKK